MNLIHAINVENLAKLIQLFARLLMLIAILISCSIVKFFQFERFYASMKAFLVTIERDLNMISNAADKLAINQMAEKIVAVDVGITIFQINCIRIEF